MEGRFMTDDDSGPTMSQLEETTAIDALNPALDTTTQAGKEAVRQRVIDALKTCYDPEIPVDIYELGLIYEIDVEDSGTVRIRMTLTSPMCPVAETLPVEVKQKLQDVPSVKGVELDLVWDPAWEPSRMSEAARLELGF
jgi:FeS assembly SUF system protein